MIEKNIMLAQMIGVGVKNQKLRNERANVGLKVTWQKDSFT